MIQSPNEKIGSRLTWAELYPPRSAEPQRRPRTTVREITVAQPYAGVYQVVGGPRFQSSSDLHRYADGLRAEIVWSV